MTTKTHRQFLMLLLALGVGGLYVIYAYDVFVDETYDTVGELRIELDEALAYGVMMTLAFSVYAMRAYRAYRENHVSQLARIADARRDGLTDALTGLANRRRFDEALAAMLRDRPDGRRDAVLMVDLNDFKPVNDRHGHAAGDAVLCAVGERLSIAVRSGDLVARIGGDEFAVLAPGAGDRVTAAAIADRILAELAAPIDVAGARHWIGAGIGVAVAPDDGGDPQAVLANADLALYRAKDARASAVRFHERAAA